MASATAALEWLAKAVGFGFAMVLTDANANADGEIGHSEIRYRECLIKIGNERTTDHRSQASIGSNYTQTVHVHLTGDIDAQNERARKAGVGILQEPETQFYGDRACRARDSDGHIWTFGRTAREVTPEEWDKASGLTTNLQVTRWLYGIRSTWYYQWLPGSDLPLLPGCADGKTTGASRSLTRMFR